MECTVAMVAFPMLEAACSLAGIPAVVDPGRLAFLAARECELGVRLPPSVTEWYAIRGAADHFIEHSCAIIARLGRLGLAADGRDLAAGRMLIARDCQDCCDWAVELPGSPSRWDVPLPGLASEAQHRASVARAADPPVWLTVSEEPEDTWTLAAPTFSTYVYAEAWDLALLAGPNGSTLGDVPLGDGDLALLRRQFAAGPTSFGWAGHFGAPGLVVHRFERPGQRVRVAAHPEQSEWSVGADTPERLDELIALLTKGNDELARELRPTIAR
jgi:hypothetical protein